VAVDSGVEFPPGPFWVWAVVVFLQATKTDSMARIVSAKTVFFISFSFFGYGLTSSRRF
jgi:hypothetical protein